ncbi:MAG: type II secretion system protein [Rubripirellula sp.]
MSLLEIVAALAIASSVAAIGIQYIQPAGDSARQRSCDLTRQLLQNDCQLYLETNGRLPQADLLELQSEQYSGDQLPTCPGTGESYRLDRRGVVHCPTHESTREE